MRSRGAPLGSIYDEAYEAGWVAAFGSVIDLIDVDTAGLARGYGIRIVRVLENMREKGLRDRKAGLRRTGSKSVDSPTRKQSDGAGK